MSDAHPLHVHPGTILLEDFLQPKGLSQYRLAKDIQVPARRINEIVLGKRGITPDTALRLSAYFGTSERFWLSLQMRYELELAKDALAQSSTANPAKSSHEIADADIPTNPGAPRMDPRLLANKLDPSWLRARTQRTPAERGKLFRRYLEQEFWPNLPSDVRGQPLSKAEKEEMLGYGPGGV